MARPAKIKPEQLEGLLTEYASLKHGAKTDWKTAKAAELNCTVQTLEYYLYGRVPACHKLSLPHAELVQGVSDAA